MCSWLLWRHYGDQQVRVPAAPVKQTGHRLIDEAVCAMLRHPPYKTAAVKGISSLSKFWSGS